MTGRADCSVVVWMLCVVDVLVSGERKKRARSLRMHITGLTLTLADGLRDREIYNELLRRETLQTRQDLGYT